MNLLHLKYAVIVAETNSMTKAAEMLFTAQPNLSRAIKELESGLGITIFRRTPKGIFPTPQGEEFLGYARKILSQVDAMEAMYKSGVEKIPQFSLSAPGAGYIESAFGSFCKTLDPKIRAEVIFAESTPNRTITNVTDSGYNLGILRCRRTQEQGYKTMLVEKELRFEIICEFDPVILMASSHPLAKSTQLTREELARYTEIAVADANAPSLQLSIARKNDIDFDTAQHIFVSDCSAALSLLSSVQGGFMLSSPMSAAALKARSLCQCTYSAEGIRSRDILIYKNSYALSALDKAFIDELMKVKRSMKLVND